MLRGNSFFLVMAVALVFAAEITGVGIRRLLEWKAFSIVVAYGAALAVIKYTPGICFYRMVVLSEPERHVRPEIERAHRFAAFAGQRFLVAGLIFTLAEIGLIISHGPASACGASLVAALPTALYALFFYAIMARAARAAVAFV